MTADDKLFMTRVWVVAAMVFALSLAAMTLTFGGLFIAAKYNDYSGGLQHSKAAVDQERNAARKAFYAACESSLANWADAPAFGYRILLPPGCPR